MKIIKSSSKKANIKLVLIFLLLFTNNFFSYINWDKTLEGQISYFIYGGIIVAFISSNKLLMRKVNFKSVIFSLLIFPFATIIMSNAEFDQPPIESFKVLFPHFVWLLYFLLHKYNVQEKTLISIMIWFVIIILAIQIVQQFTYPNAVFGVYSKEQQNNLSLEDNVEIRNGLYRFRLYGSYLISMIILFFYWIKLQKKYSMKNMIIIFIALVSIYLTLVRQLQVATILTIFFSFIFIKSKKAKLWATVSSVIFAIILYIYADELFYKMVLQTTEESSKDNIRLLSLAFYWQKIIHDPFAFLFGNGVPASDTNFGHLSQLWNNTYHFYTSDIGFVGQWFHYGLIYILIYLYLLYMLLIKYRKMLPVYIRLFVFSTFLTIAMIYPLTGPFNYIIWCFVLYISDLHINKSPLRLCNE